jgi:hypothetical protein
MEAVVEDTEGGGARGDWGGRGRRGFSARRRRTPLPLRARYAGKLGLESNNLFTILTIIYLPAIELVIEFI